MAESVTETGGFTQDLFSPLQFCEVVEEGQQQTQQQSLQQLHQHQQAQINQQQMTNLQASQQSHHHQQQQSHNPNQSQIQGPSELQQTHQRPQPQQQQAPPPPPPHQQQHSIKQETQQQQQHHQQQQSQQSQQQPLQPHLHLLNNSNGKIQPLMNTSAVEIFLSPNQVQLQSVSSPLVAVQHQQLPQPMYQVHLTRQQQQTLQQMQLNPIHLQNQPQTHNIHIGQQNQQSIPHSQSQSLTNHMNVEQTIVANGTSESYTLPAVTHTTTKPPSTNAVATQTTPTDRTTTEDDEPEIIFTSVSTATTQEPSSLGPPHPSNDSEIKSKQLKVHNNTTSSGTNGAKPIKRTWRRPWKKKKEREKRQPVKKARRVKRRRIIVPKKNVIHIDPRHGPPIDTSNTLVERESEDTINQLKQKRQRIKLNRNSGREYINRLGKVVRARKIGSPCNCPLKCWDRMGSKILEIFNNFWDLCDFNLQNSYLFTCLKLCDVKRRYTKKPAEESRRQNTFEYFVRISGKHLRVCKKAFMSSHGLTSDKRLRTLFSQMKDGALIPEPDRRGKHLRPTKSQQNGHHLLPHNNNNNSSNHHNGIHYGSNQTSKANTKQKNRHKKKQPLPHRMEPNKQAMYTPPAHPVAHLHPHCTPPPPPAHGTSMQEPPHAYIPNGEIYFPGHYLEPPQAMAPHHMNQIPSCQKMLETPAYFMAGMKENTFHQ